MSNATELLRRALESLHGCDDLDTRRKIIFDIHTYLAVEKEAEELVIMTVGQIADAYNEGLDWQSFLTGIRAAENYHKIGERNE